MPWIAVNYVHVKYDKCQTRRRMKAGSVVYIQTVGVSCRLEGNNNRGYSAATFGTTTVNLDHNGRASARVPIRLADYTSHEIFFFSVFA